MKVFMLISMLVMSSMVTMNSFAEEAKPVAAVASSIAPVVVPVVVADPLADVPVTDFLSQVFEAVKGFGGMPWGLKIAAILFLIIASMKVSIIRIFTWDKVPDSLKVWLAPFLAFLAGLFSLGKFDKVSLMAWVFAGFGAVLLDQLLEGVKKIPGIGPQYVSLINFISKFLKKPVQKV